MPLTFHHKQLPNGLDIVAERNPDAHSFAAGLFVKTGSRDEQADVNGVSHFGQVTRASGARISEALLMDIV